MLFNNDAIIELDIVLSPYSLLISPYSKCYDSLINVQSLNKKSAAFLFKLVFIAECTNCNEISIRV